MEFLAFLKLSILLALLHLVTLVTSSPLAKLSVDVAPVPAPSSVQVQALIENEESKVYNGSKADIIYPFLANFVQVPKDKTNNFYNIFCGGTLIDPLHVLTAAHCVNEFASLWSEWDIEIWIATSSNKPRPPVYEQKFTLSSLYDVNYHTNFSQDDIGIYHNDIAVVKLPSAAIINDKVSTICIGDLDSFNDLDVTGTGYGHMDCIETQPDALQYAIGKSLDGNACSEAFKVPGRIGSDITCSFLKNPESGKFASLARGDSGGPLFTIRNNEYVQIGVLSLVAFDNDNCPLPTYPNVYCNPGYYKKYLEDHGAKPRYCK